VAATALTKGVGVTLDGAGTPVMQQVAFMETPSTKAEMTWTRFTVLRRFIENIFCKHLYNKCLR
jgi:hypothetical protein